MELNKNISKILKKYGGVLNKFNYGGSTELCTDDYGFRIDCITRRRVDSITGKPSLVGKAYPVNNPNKPISTPSLSGYSGPTLQGPLMYPNTFKNFDQQPIPLTSAHLKQNEEPVLIGNVPGGMSKNLSSVMYPEQDIALQGSPLDTIGKKEAETSTRKFGTPNYEAILGFNALTTLGLGLSQRYDERRNQRGNVYSNLTANYGASNGVNYGYSKYGGMLKKFDEGGGVDEDYDFLFGDDEKKTPVIENVSQSAEASEKARQETITQEKEYRKQRREKNNSYLDDILSTNNTISFNQGSQNNNATPSSSFQNNNLPESQGTYANEDLRKMFAKIENSGNTDFSKDHDGKPGGAFGPYGWMDAGANNSHFRDFFDNNIGGLKTKYKDYSTYLSAAKSNGPESQHIESVFLNEMKKRNNNDIKQMAAYNLYGNVGKRLYQSGDINKSNVIGKNASIATYLEKMFKKEGGSVQDLSPTEALALYKKGIKFKII
jgi:hypothetical protein